MSLRPLLLAFSAGLLCAQDSEVPLALNLPTAEGLQGWQPALRFTHRFLESAKGNPRDLYGLDGGNAAGFGLDLGIAAVPGLNAQIYRTADDKTLVFALQQRLVHGPVFRLAVRGERFDEGVQRASFGQGEIGISGTAVQLPAELLAGPVTFLAVPTFLSRTTTKTSSLATYGLGLRWAIAGSQSLLVEHYPRPGRLDSERFHPGWAFGYRFQTQRHRFTLLATTAQGTTAHQVLGGDYNGGPVEPGQWSLGFNLVRLF